MKKSPIIFFDYDNTLCDAKTHKIPDSTAQSLYELVENGYQIAIASGRSYPKLKLTGDCERFPWSGYCLNNGQHILDGDENTLHHHLIPDNAIQEVIRTARDLKLNVFFNSLDGDFLLEDANAYVLKAHNFFNEPIPAVKPYNGQRVDKILIYNEEGYDYAPFKAIDEIDCFISVSSYADLVCKGVSKYSAILELLNHLGLEDDYLAFGDSQNDIEMLTHAKYGVAMGNADPVLKEIADEVTDSVSEDGIRNALVKLGYLNA